MAAYHRRTGISFLTRCGGATAPAGGYIIGKKPGYARSTRIAQPACRAIAVSLVGGMLPLRLVHS